MALARSSDLTRPPHRSHTIDHAGWWTTLSTLPAGSADEEPSHAPRLADQRVHDLHAESLSFLEGSVHILDQHRCVRRHGRGGVLGDELDFRTRFR